MRQRALERMEQTNKRNGSEEGVEKEPFKIEKEPKIYRWTDLEFKEKGIYGDSAKRAVIAYRKERARKHLSDFSSKLRYLYFTKDGCQHAYWQAFILTKTKLC